jgi:phage portal protein BeeE
MGRQFLTYSLMPWIERFESELRLKLFADDTQFFAEFLTDALVRPNLAERANSYSKMITAHVMTPAEARERENLPFIEGTDEFFSPNTTPGNASTPT